MGDPENYHRKISTFNPQPHQVFNVCWERHSGGFCRNSKLYFGTLIYLCKDLCYSNAGNLVKWLNIFEHEDVILLKS